AEVIRDHLHHLAALVEDDRSEEASTARVLLHAVLQVLGYVPHVMGLIFHPDGPERKPSEPGFQDGESNLRLAIEQAGAEKGSHCPHGAPGVRRRAAEKGVTPEVAITGVAFREAVMDVAQSGLVHRLP